ncbi:ABC transporter substrate-binding protein [Streptosporangium sp. NBC_01755]|uniref:ABC transporter substrate-binding protein n=1 Tax=unclassified Streptosporangium TaxID=2632669 RepID=UPI002DDB23EC|nr:MULTISPECIES: ABC transporter substrate-binding protein [unclassified Streptosporangium]WSA23251.1 ABC transporter substrate-binding protein [Streptosporangium sp. NBC_01810]WSC98611.1 ABC transporter substrate-binding protein [Streptosporangium sp. NBC_01755]
MHRPPATPVARGRRSTLGLTSVVLVGALALAACGQSTSGAPGGSGGSDVRKQTLIIAENEPPATFDPVQADNSTVDEVSIPAYDTLVKYAKGGVIAPAVATEWTFSKDGKTLDLTLRDDVTFHDGTRLTATDVKYTLDRIGRLQMGVASLMTAYDSAEAVDDTHLKISLKQPYAPFLGALSRVYLLNSKLVQANAGSDDGRQWLAANGAGSGPYKLTGYTPNQEAKFTRHDGYWGGFTKQAKDVVIRYLPQAATQKTALSNGDVDIAMDIDPNDWAGLESGGHVVDKADTNVQLYVFFKMKDSPAADKALREAITYAYDYDQHQSAILKGAGKKAAGVLASTMACADPTVAQAGYDLDKAKSILDAAGLKNVTLTMSYLKATAEMEQAATLLQSDLAKIGVKVELSAVTYPQYVEMLKSNETTPDLGMIYGFPPYPDPDSVLHLQFNSKFINNGQNSGGYHNPKVDKLVEDAQKLTDEEARCALYKEAQQTIAADHPSINMSNPQYVTVHRKGLTGYAYDPAHHQTVDVYQVQVG